jgi:hypothetical protein
MAVSEDPDDLEAVKPGQFIIGRPLISLPEPILHNELTINCPRRRGSGTENVSAILVALAP